MAGNFKTDYDCAQTVYREFGFPDVSISICFFLMHFRLVVIDVDHFLVVFLRILCDS